MKNITFSEVFNPEGVATIISSLIASLGRGQQGPAQRCGGRCQMGAGAVQQRQRGGQKFRTGMLKLGKTTAGMVTDIVPL